MPEARTTKEMSQERQLVISVPKTDLTIVSKAIKVSQQKAQELITKYGEEMMVQVVEIFEDFTDISIKKFSDLCNNFELKPEEVKKLYVLRIELQGKVEDNRFHRYYSLDNLAYLAQRFPDFKEADEEKQLEMIETIIELFGLHCFPNRTTKAEVLMHQRVNTFSNAVSILLEQAEKEGVDELEMLLFYLGEKAILSEYYYLPEERDE
jgi:hypothetical protein